MAASAIFNFNESDFDPLTFGLESIYLSTKIDAMFSVVTEI